MPVARSGRRTEQLPVIHRDVFEREVLQAERPVLAELYDPAVADRSPGTSAGQPRRPASTVSVGIVDYGAFIRAITRVLRDDGEDVKLVRLPLAEYEDLLDGYRREKGYHAYDFDKLPGAALFRGGELVTTFNPTLNYTDPAVQFGDITRQFRRFLENFVHYDPDQVTFNHKKKAQKAKKDS